MARRAFRQHFSSRSAPLWPDGWQLVPNLQNWIFDQLPDHYDASDVALIEQGLWARAAVMRCRGGHVINPDRIPHPITELL